MKNLIYIIGFIAIMLVAACSGIGGIQEYVPEEKPEEKVVAELLNPTEDYYDDIPEYAEDEIEDAEREQDTTAVDTGETAEDERIIPIDSMPPGGEKLRTKNIRSLSRTFNDVNRFHLVAAKQNGIEPIMTIADAWNLKMPVLRIESTNYYFVEKARYSLPYLVPRAKTLLDDIAKNWKDSLNARGGGDYRLKVTSILRTGSTISKLKRVNRAAVDSSAHRYGTTFDISYRKFICDNPEKPRSAEDLKNLLAEILYDLRENGRCYVKYEHRQGCFHITAR